MDPSKPFRPRYVPLGSGQATGTDTTYREDYIPKASDNTIIHINRFTPQYELFRHSTLRLYIKPKVTVTLEDQSLTLNMFRNKNL